MMARQPQSTRGQRIAIAVALIAAVACLVCIVLFSSRREPIAARDAEPATQPSPAQELLARDLPEINFEHVPVKDAFDFLQTLTNGVALDVDWDALQQAGVKLEAPITLHAPQKSFSEVIDEVLGQLNATKPLAYKADENRLRISTKELLDGR